MILVQYTRKLSLLLALFLMVGCRVTTPQPTLTQGAYWFAPTFPVLRGLHAKQLQIVDTPGAYVQYGGAESGQLIIDTQPIAAPPEAPAEARRWVPPHTSAPMVTYPAPNTFQAPAGSRAPASGLTLLDAATDL